MAVEHKQISLEQFKALEDAPGGFEGYASRFGELDDVGDIVLPGAYAEGLAEFLQKGFTAHSHDWSVNGVIGFPVDAHEDAIGLFIRSQFHSTPDAQTVRTKAQERQAAKKQVSLSIGYEVPPGGFAIVAKRDYEQELPKYVPQSLLSDVLERAQRFSQIRLLSKINLFEHSIVTAPALRSAAVTRVKSVEDKQPEQPEQVETKGKFEDALDEQANSLYNLTNTLQRTIWQEQMLQELAEEAGLSYDLEAEVNTILQEFSARVLAAVVGGDGADGAELATSGISAKSLLPAGMTFAAHSEAVRATVGEFVARAKAIMNLRAERKEGRKIAEERRQLIKQCAELLMQLYEESEPPKKDEDEKQSVLTEVMALLRDNHERAANVRQLQRS